LFGHKTTSGKKRTFDPSSDCVVASQKAKKKATNQRIKAKNVTVVLLHNKEEKVPKGRKRSASGRIKKLEFKRCMKATKVRDIISEGFQGFDVQNIQFLVCGQDNVLTKFENQELDGDGIIDLAGQGCAYLLQVSSKLYIVHATCMCLTI